MREQVKLIGAMLFAMAAGAAAHHQYIVLSQVEGPVQAEVVTIYQMKGKLERAWGIQEGRVIDMYFPTPEEVEEWMEDTGVRVYVQMVDAKG